MSFNYKKVKGIIVPALILGLVSFADTALAQTKTPQTQPPQQQQQATTDISDADIKQFVDASTRLLAVQKEGEKVMLTILQEEKLEVEKFNQLAQAHQQQKLNEAGATPEELAAFNKAAERIIALQPEMEKNMEQAIQKDGMTVDKYEQIMLAYQQNPTLQARVKKMMGQQ
ncbi:DUF4168 domain-containing protein [Pontibacter ruber]|uniref:DUF4168 domain-containing protein n=1 Tax=Pontibacter ruber TaxID=1343895 RepID=A0ABW5CX20_9BACT|nr:DUF4168 domain-containing protein [Pontibacter ruber]